MFNNVRQFLGPRMDYLEPLASLLRLGFGKMRSNSFRVRAYGCPIHLLKPHSLGGGNLRFKEEGRGFAFCENSTQSKRSLSLGIGRFLGTLGSRKRIFGET